MSDPVARAIDIYASRLAIRPQHPHILERSSNWSRLWSHQPLASELLATRASRATLLRPRGHLWSRRAADARAHVQDMGEGDGVDRRRSRGAVPVGIKGPQGGADLGSWGAWDLGGMERAQLSTGRPKVAESREISAWTAKSAVFTTWIYLFTSATAPACTSPRRRGGIGRSERNNGSDTSEIYYHMDMRCDLCVRLRFWVEGGVSRADHDLPPHGDRAEIPESRDLASRRSTCRLRH